MVNIIGEGIHNLAKDLWPINRSITGDGVRSTLKKINNLLGDLEVHSISSGTNVLDWIIPKEWKVSSAKIIGPENEVICDIADNNLHLVGYSVPFRGVMELQELQAYLYSLPDQPNAIPYVTSYYQDSWGFCISEMERKQLKPGIYEVLVETELFDGELNYGEIYIKGRSSQEIFLSTYICHPSMANNELSGPCVTTFLVKWLKEQKNLRYSYRVVFVPETIGSIAYLSKNLEHLRNTVIAGFNVSCVGDDRNYSFLPSRNGSTLSDRVACHVLSHISPDFKKYSWFDRGSDERQYCAPGVDLPIASIMRTKYGEYPEYHTSLDNLEDVVTPEGLYGGYEAIRRSLELIEKNYTYTSTVKGEPQMGRRGLYPNLSQKGSADSVKLMMDFLSCCDGNLSVLDTAELLNVPAWDLFGIIETLKKQKLIEAIN